MRGEVVGVGEEGFGKLFVPFGKILATPLVMKMKVTVIFTSLSRRIVSETGLFIFLEYELNFILKNKKNWKDKRKR